MYMYIYIYKYSRLCGYIIINNYIELQIIILKYVIAIFMLSQFAPKIAIISVQQQLFN